MWLYWVLTLAMHCRLGRFGISGNRFTIRGYGAITTPAGMDFPRRLQMIYEDMNTILQKYRPDVLSIEKLYFTNNKTTGIDVAQARGVILLAATMHGLKVHEYTPMQVKQSVVATVRQKNGRLWR